MMLDIKYRLTRAPGMEPDAAADGYMVIDGSEVVITTQMGAAVTAVRVRLDPAQRLELAEAMLGQMTVHDMARLGSLASGGSQLRTKNRKRLEVIRAMAFSLMAALGVA